MASEVQGLLRSSWSTAPFFLFTRNKAHIESPTSVVLDDGSVRIAVSQFVRNAPFEAYVNLNISSGQIRTGPTGLDLSSDPYYEVGADTVEISLQIAPNVTASTDFQLLAPRNVVFEFNTSIAILKSADDAVQSIFGSNFTISHSNGSPTIETTAADTSRLSIPFITDSARLHDLHSAPRISDFHGSATILRVDWILELLSASAALDFSQPLSGSGGLLVHVGAGLRLAVNTLGPRNAHSSPCGACIITIIGDNLELSGTVTLPTMKMTLFDKSKVSIRGERSMVSFTVQRSPTQELFIVDGLVSAVLNKPLDVNDESLSFRSSGRLTLAQSTDNKQEVLVKIDAVQQSPFRPPNTAILPTYALQNLLLQCSDPIELHLNGWIRPPQLQQVQRPTVEAGTARLLIPIQRALPFLPDPYASNMVDFPFEVLPSPPILGNLDITLAWNLAEPVNISMQLPDLSLGNYRTRFATEASRGDDSNIFETLLAQDKVTFNTGPHPPALLDLSTNASQFGIEFLRSGDVPTVTDANMTLPATQIGICALPPVAWEPVLTTQPEPDFPALYVFPNDGPSVRIATKAVSLVPIEPETALETVKGAYNAWPSADVAARFNMPFGLIAYAALHREPPFPLLPRNPTMSFNEPSFTSVGYQSVRQVSIRAHVPPELSPRNTETSDSIPGSMLNLKYRFGTSAAPISVLGSMSGDLNQEFGPPPLNRARHHKALIPASRVDISGFGESMSSEWFDYLEPAPATQRVDLDVYVGRSERAVIEQTFEILHCAAKHIRTVTMQRLNNGLITRKVVHSPGSIGIYKFENDQILTNPGFVTGYFNLRNLRDLPEPNVTVNGFDFAPIEYDADVEIPSDTGLVRFPVYSHRGFTALTKPPPGSGAPSFGPNEYAELVRQHGERIGGPINAIVKLNNRMVKFHHISVGFSRNPITGNLEFVIAPYHTDLSSGHSAWSWLQHEAGKNPTVVGPSGVPIIRQGLANASSAPTPLRFAAPGDLWNTTPAVDYALLHSGRNQRVIFPRPRIEADGRNEISSDVIPLIADPYALSTSLGPFPAFDLCIPLERTTPDKPKYRLSIGQNGHLKLYLPVMPFQAPVTERPIFQSQDLSTTVYTNETEITLEINDDASPPWRFEMTKVALATATAEASSNGQKEELQRVIGSLVSTPTGSAEFKHSEIIFGPPLQPLKDVLSFMQALGFMSPLQVSMTNEWSLLVWMQFDIEELLILLGAEPPPGTEPTFLDKLKDFIKKFVPEASVRFEQSTKIQELFQGLKARIVVRIPKALAGLDVLLTAIFNMRTSAGGSVAAGRTIEGGVGGGVGYSDDFALGQFQAYALLTFSYIANLATGSWGIGVALLLKGEITIAGGWVSVAVSAEMKGILLNVKCIRAGVEQTTQWGVFQATFAVEVHICFVLDIGAEVSVQVENRLNDGPCDWQEFGVLT